MRDFVLGRSSRHVVLVMHRGLGKSYLAVCLALELGLRTPNIIVKYLAPTAKMVRQITIPLFNKITLDCPFRSQIVHKKLDSLIDLPNGSQIWLAGTDGGNAESQRGSDNHFTIMDEEGFMDDPDYVVNDIILPRALPVDGQILHVSTPPLSPSHPFGRRMQEKGENIFTLTLDDNPDLSPEDKAMYESEYGGRESSAFRREFLCELVVDKSSAVIPETAAGQTLSRSEDLQVISLLVVSPAVMLKAACLDDGWVVFEERAEPYGNAHALAEGAEGRKYFVGDSKAAYGLPGWMEAVHVPNDLGDSMAKVRARIGAGELRISPECPVTRRHVTDAVWKSPAKNGFGPSGDGMRFDTLRALSVLAHLPGPHPPADTENFFPMVP